MFSVVGFNERLMTVRLEKSGVRLSYLTERVYCSFRENIL